MANYFNLGYGVRVAAQESVDADRYSADTLAARDALIGSLREYEGLQVYVKSTKKLYILKDVAIPTWEEVGGSSGGVGGALEYLVNQAGHGFIVGEVVSLIGAGYVYANATNFNVPAIGIVSDIIDVDNFAYKDTGESVFTKFPLTTGVAYYLDTINGGVTAIEPGDFKQSLFVAQSPSSILVNIGDMFVAGKVSGAPGGKIIHTAAAGASLHSELTLDDGTNPHGTVTNTPFIIATTDVFVPDEGGNYIIDGVVEVNLTYVGSVDFLYVDLYYKSGTLTIDWDAPNPVPMPTFEIGHLYRIVKNAISWDTIDMTGNGVLIHSGLTLDDGTNPHGTTKSDVGLGSVDNTSDLDKPISTATQTALDLKASQQDFTDHENDSAIHITLNERDAFNNSPTLATGANPLATQADITAIPDGDMLKSQYDQDDNGVVDDAEKLGGQLPSVYNQSAHVANTSLHLSNDEQDALRDGSNLPTTNNLLVTENDLTPLLAAKEDDLGNPTTDGDTLSSTIGGVRSWVTPVDTADAMLKSVYDTDDNGVVDNTEQLAGQDPAFYTIYDGNDTALNILALNPTTYLNQTWWAFDEKRAYVAKSAITEGIDVWQAITIEYDPDTDTYRFPTTLDGQTQNAGQEQFLPCHTLETPSFTAQEPKVFLVAGTKVGEGNIKNVVSPIAADLTSGSTVGINTTNKNALGYLKIGVFGDVNDVKTDQWAEKAILYVDPLLPGELTDVKPASKAFAVAEVLISHITAGKLFVNTVRAASDEAIFTPAGSDRLYFTGDQTVSPDPSGTNTFYLIKRNNNGIVASASEDAICPDNTKIGVTKRHIGPQFISDIILVPGTYNSTIEFSVDNTGGRERVYLEVYLANADGTVVDSGSGLPVGGLGVPPLVSGVSGLLNSPSNTTLYATVTTNLGVSVTGLAGQRLVYYILGEKVGTAGGSKTFTFFYGSAHLTFVEVPKLIVLNDLGDVINIAPLSGDILMAGVDGVYRNTPPTSLVTGRMKWEGTYDARPSYLKDSVTRDGDWTMIANKETTDRPAPQPENTPSWTWEPTPAWGTQTELGDIWYGFQFTIVQMIEITGWRIWATGNINDSYVASLYDYNNSSNPILIESRIIPAGQPLGWFSSVNALLPFIAYPGEVFRLVVQVHSEVTDTPYSHQWRWLAGGSDPGGGIITYDNDNARLKINEAGQGADLLLLKEEDSITLTEVADSSLWASYRITGPATDEGTWISVPAVVVATGGSIRNNIDVITDWVVKGIATNTDYVEDLNGIPNYTPNTSVKGFVTNIGNDVLDPALPLNDNIYGVDLLGDLYIASPDWEAVAHSSGGGSSSGGVGVTIHNELTDRDVIDGHPISAITGLQAELDAKELSLGNPSIDGQLISSTIAGVRSWVDPTSGGGASGFAVNQVAHGFTIGDPISEASGIWSRANTADEANTAEGLIIEVVDVDNFIASTVGEIEWLSHGHAINKWLYLDSVGNYTVTPPANDGDIVQYCFKTMDAARVYINISQPDIIALDNGAGGAGDMLKSVYDTNNNGVVDNSETTNGFSVDINVPSDALFTDTVYNHPTGDGNEHIPPNGTLNNLKVLTATAVAGVYTWETPAAGVTDHTLLTNIGNNTHAQIDTHITNTTTNPHSVDRTDVGLSNVDNTTDANKPISTATQTALNDKVDDAQVLTNVPSGALFTDTVYDSTNVDSHIANTTTNPHSVDRTDVGLDQVDNTSDANKPVSTLQQTALNGKVDDAQVLTNVPSGALFTDTIYDSTAVDSHIANSAIHFAINDAGNSINEAWSSSKISNELLGKEPANANIQAHITNIEKHVSQFERKTTAFDAAANTNYTIDGIVEMSLEIVEGDHYEVFYKSGIWTFDWQAAAPVDIPALILGHLYRLVYTNATWFMWDITRVDTNRIVQTQIDMGDVSGAVVIDNTTGVGRMRIIGNVSSVSMLNSMDGTTFLLNVENASGSTINWSGFYAEDGIDPADLNPIAGASTFNQYWISGYAGASVVSLVKLSQL